MTHAEWGIKKVCNHCGIKFYDKNNPAPTCPSCHKELRFSGAMKLKTNQQSFNMKKLQQR